MYRWKGRVSPIEANLGYWLHYVGYRISHELCLRTRKFGVTAAEWVVLRALYEKGAMPSHLALRLGLTRGAISKLAARLEAKDMIHREKSLPDRRATLMTLTQLGRVLVPVLTPMADENDTRYFGRMAQTPRQTIEWVLKSIVRRDRLRFVPLSQCCIIPPARYGYAEGYGDAKGYGDGYDQV
jgi:DNA-binding MarR family transcriptional regulator